MESRKSSRKVPRSYDAPEISQTFDMAQPDQHKVVAQAYESVKMLDILPLLLCIGIVILLYFIVREIQNEQENQEARYASLLKRMDSLEKKDDVTVPGVKQMDDVKSQSIWASSEAADIVERSQKSGTYTLKNSVVSFEPEEGEDTDDENSLPPVVELPDEEKSDSEDGEFS